MSTLYDIPAPAKINLFLHVTGRRPDGYHLLQTVFRFVDLQDVLHIETRGDGRIVRSTGLPGVAEQDDLAVRAALALQRATGTRAGAAIALEKRIPQGGGLGGGSSDAASVLIALNRLWNTGLDRQALMRLALPLGADVPVFVYGRPAFAEGVGERLSAVDLPERAYLLAMPAGGGVPTAGVFADPDLTRDTDPVTIASFAAMPDSRFGRNDLEAVVFRRHPAVERAAGWLAGQGLQVRMSGSGACLFAEFADMPQAVLAQQEIAVKMRVADPDAHRREEPGSCIAWIRACRSLDRHPLRNWIA